MESWAKDIDLDVILNFSERAFTESGAMDWLLFTLYPHTFTLNINLFRESFLRFRRVKEALEDYCIGFDAY